MINSIYSTITTVRGISSKGFLTYLEQLWKQRGDAFVLPIGGQGMLFAIHPDYVKHVNVDASSHYDKGASYNVPRRYLFGNGLITSTGALWRTQRKLMAPFFTPTNILAYTNMIETEGKRQIERWEELARTEQTIDMTDEMMGLLARIVLRTMFSIDNPEENDRIRDAIDYLIANLSFRTRSPFRLPDSFPTSANRRYKSSREAVQGYIIGLINRRREQAETNWPDDILTRLMQARDSDTGQRMSDAQLLDECITIYAAGSETTARTLGFAWYILARHPDIAEQLHLETDKVISGEPLTHDAMKKLTYTMQITRETLRLYPAAPLYLRDCIDGDEIAGIKITQGRPVYMSPFLTHRHPEFWPEPERFNPDRWTPEAEKARHPYAFHAFAAGARICIGNNLSLMEGQILLAMLARHFAPRLNPSDHVITVDQHGTLYAKNGIPMQIVKRASAPN